MTNDHWEIGGQVTLCTICLESSWAQLVPWISVPQSGQWKDGIAALIFWDFDFMMRWKISSVSQQWAAVLDHFPNPAELSLDKTDEQRLTGTDKLRCELLIQGLTEGHWSLIPNNTVATLEQIYPSKHAQKPKKLKDNIFVFHLCKLRRSDTCVKDSILQHVETCL